MFNSNSHQIGDMARMRSEDLIREADDRRLRRLAAPESDERWSKLRATVGDWLIAAGQHLKPTHQSMIGRQAPQS